MGRSNEEKTTAEIFAEMQRDSEEFFDHAASMTTRWKLQRDVNNYLTSLGDLSHVNGNDVIKCIRPAICQIIMEEGK